MVKLDLNEAGPQKENRLDPDTFYTAKEAGLMAGVKANRIHYFSEAGIIIPTHKTQKGDGILTYSYYDCVNVLEIYLINRLTTFFIPKRSIKEFFENIRGMRNVLDPFKIADHKGQAKLIFSYDSDGHLNYYFLDGTHKKASKDSVQIVVDLKLLVSELFNRVEKLP